MKNQDTITIDELIDIINSIDSAVIDSYPVIFKNADEDDSIINITGLNKEGDFVWKTEDKTLLQINEDLWDDWRIEDGPFDYIISRKDKKDIFEILEGSFSGITV